MNPEEREVGLNGIYPESSEPEKISRREFLQRVGKYSAAAAFVFAGTPALFTGCKQIQDLFTGKDGSTPQKAIAGKLETATKVELKTKGSIKYFMFDLKASGDYKFSILSDGTITGQTNWSLLDKDLKLISWGIVGIGYYWFDGWKGLSAQSYYVKFEAVDGTADFSFSLKKTDSSYSDYSDSSWSNGGWSNASWDNYSDWSDYSRWADAYSDWSNVWGNWMQSW